MLDHLTAAEWFGLAGSALLLVSAVRDLVLRWWIWILRHRQAQPGLTGLRQYLVDSHQAAREAHPALDSLLMAAGATCLGVSYYL